MKALIKTVVIKIGSEYYGFEAEWVQSIVKKTEITPIPNNQFSYLMGMTDIHGYCMPVIDLHKKFNMEPVDVSDVIVALSYKDTSLAFLVEQVDKIIDVPVKNVFAIPEILKSKYGDCIEYIFHFEGNLMCMLSPNKLLAQIRSSLPEIS